MKYNEEYQKMTGGFFPMNLNPYFSTSDMEYDTFYHIPKIFQLKYNHLSPLAKLCWSILFGLQRNCIEQGWFDKKSGRIYFYHLDLFINKFVIDVFQNVTPNQLIYELVEHQLLEVDESEVIRFYLLKPEYDFAALNSRQQEEIDFFSNLNQMVKSTKRNKSAILKEFIDDHEITDEFIINELYKEIIVLGQNKQFDLVKIDEVYQNILSSIQEKPVSSKVQRDNLVNEAIDFMSPYLHSSEKAQLTDEDILVLYTNFDKIDYLIKSNLVNISLLLTLKSQYKLTSKEFSSLLDNALHTYDYTDKNGVHFVYFFEQIILNRQIVEKEQILIGEISDKLYALPNTLKNFVYSQMLKTSEHFPQRYQLLIQNLRGINKIYEDKGGEGLSDEVFKKAFRNLLMDNEIHNIVGYFSRGIDFALKDGLSPSTETTELPTPENKEMDDKTWMEIVVNAKETKGDVEKMGSKEREAYFNKAEQIRKKLELLRQEG